MKIKNIFLWLREKLSDPHFLRNLFSYRKMWGAFSIYSHQRRSDGKPNISYSSRKKARKAAESMSKKYGVPFIAYKCLFCDGWHIAKDTERVTDKTKVDGWDIPERKVSESIPLDYNAIKATNVPDLHYVYGGFRGATCQCNLATCCASYFRSYLHNLRRSSDYRMTVPPFDFRFSWFLTTVS